MCRDSHEHLRKCRQPIVTGVNLSVDFDRYRVRRLWQNPRRTWEITRKRIRTLAWDRYARQIRDPKVIAQSGYHLRSPQERGEEGERIDASIRASGITHQDLALSLSAFQRYIGEADYWEEHQEYVSLYENVIYEKMLEHYATLLLLEADRLPAHPLIYMDVGSEDSAAPSVYRQLSGWQVYRQDLAYQPGIHGEYIGGSASEIPLPDESIHLMALHCAYEHFEGDSDVGLVREAQRLLKPGGRLVIVPLYLSDRDRIMTDPVVSVPAGMQFPDGVEVICVPGWWNRFGRLYSVETLQHRVLSQWTCGRAWLVRFLNSRSLHAQCHLAYGLVLEKQ